MKVRTSLSDYTVIYAPKELSDMLDLEIRYSCSISSTGTIEVLLKFGNEEYRPMSINPYDEYHISNKKRIIRSDRFQKWVTRIISDKIKHVEFYRHAIEQQLVEISTCTRVIATLSAYKRERND